MALGIITIIVGGLDLVFAIVSSFQGNTLGVVVGAIFSPILISLGVVAIQIGK